MLLNLLPGRHFSTTRNLLKKAGDEYKKMYQARVGYILRGKSKKFIGSFTPKQINKLYFGKNKLRFVGLHSLVQNENALNTHKPQIENVKVDEKEPEPATEAQLHPKGMSNHFLKNMENTYLSKFNLLRQLHPTGMKRQAGRYAGRPYFFADDKEYQSFQSQVLHVERMKVRKFSRQQNFYVLACVGVGNGRGVAGIGFATALSLQQAVALAKKEALRNLYYIPMYDNRTLLHENFGKFGLVKLTVAPKPRGYGLFGCNVFKSICELAGIKDAYSKLYGCIRHKFRNCTLVMQVLCSQERNLDMCDRTATILCMKKHNALGPMTILTTPSKSAVDEHQKRFSNPVNYNEVSTFHSMSHYTNLHRVKHDFRLSHFHQYINKRVVPQKYKIIEVLRSGD